MVFCRAGLVLSFLYLVGTLDLLGLVAAFSLSRSDNLAVYWGQDSANHQQRLSSYCQDDTIDVIPLAFLYVFFGEGGEPEIDFANICNQYGNTFPGSDLADCHFLASDIKTCQSKGKIVTISLGGATGKVGFPDAGTANDFAKTIWNMFLGGESDTRPFGDAVLDGVDLDIESGSSSYYSTFVNNLRTLSKNSDKRYYITAAPQCPFPDASLGNAINNAVFDAVFVQFYNNDCGLSQPSKFNFDTWDQWARKTSPNPDVKVYIGAPASPQAADSGYVDAEALVSIAKSMRNKYSSFGGIMLWDADSARNNDNFDLQVKKALKQGGGSSSKGGATSDTSSSVTPKTTKPTTSSKTTAPTSSSAASETTAPASSSVVVEATVPTDYEDPRKLARVKRPISYTIMQPEKRNIDKPRISSRFFRF